VSVTVEQPPITSGTPSAVRGPLLSAFLPRFVPSTWPATCSPGEELVAELTSGRLVVANRDKHSQRAVGVRLLVAWLADQAGDTWQQRWIASGADAAGAAWRQVPAAWLAARGEPSPWRRDALVGAVPLMIAADVVRPSLDWLVGGGPARGGGLFVRTMRAVRDPEGFARLAASCAADPAVSAVAGGQVLFRAALIMAAKGGTLTDVTVGDVVELLDAQAHIHVSAAAGRVVFYRLLHQMGVFAADAPPTLRALRTAGQRSPEELIDRYRLACRPIRDLLVDYLKERQPALDYNSLESLANYLGKLFWSDLERHHPGIDRLHLSTEVAEGWKRRLRTVSRTVITASGERTQITTERINYRECLTPVRAFYLDLAHWAVEHPERWATWVAPCPIGAEEINRKKAKRRLKSRMDARTRERLPVLPVLVRCVDERRKTAAALLAGARHACPGEKFNAAGTTLVRVAVDPRAGLGKVWAQDPAGGPRRELVREDDHAFWAWAIVEVLRATGVRVEELRELNHHSLIQYRLPTTGEIVPLLQILPSKTDAERLLVVSPELSEVLSAIILRVSDGTGTVPLVPGYDTHERTWSTPMPLLFQRRINGENRAIADSMVRTILDTALAHTGLIDPVDGQPLRYTPHDFRRMFITDAVMNGLPPHIAQIIAGHRDINVTMGYKAVYPDEALQAHLAYLARRRSLRPTDEYRTLRTAEGFHRHLRPSVLDAVHP
jgi:integrase